jgi:hypothetical protein
VKDKKLPIQEATKLPNKLSTSGKTLSQKNPSQKKKKGLVEWLKV